MKFLPDMAWWAALMNRRHRPTAARLDPADMGTAYGLDSITIIDFEPTRAPIGAAAAEPGQWQRRGRSKL
jgi:hypothetical protein